MIRPFALHRPETLAEAVELVAAGGMPYCGGTELIPVMRMGLLDPGALVDLKRVGDLDGIADEDDTLVLRARVTHAQAYRSPLVRRHAPVLAAATSQLGNARVRATGTLAGNVCFAEPRSDVLTALAALDAEVELCSVTGTRRLPVTDFVVGGLVTTREDTEVVRALRLPRCPGTGVYLRFQPAEYPTVTVAAVSRPGDCRVVVGAVADGPAVFGFPEPADVDADAIAERVEVTGDAYGGEDYKRHLTAVYVRRALARLAEAPDA